MGRIRKLAIPPAWTQVWICPRANGEDFTAKDFRTWGGTVLAAMALREFEMFDTHTQAKRNVIAAIQKVAERLGNTPTNLPYEASPAPPRSRTNRMP